MSRRPLVVAVLAWLVVVALGSGVVWAVISRAGESLVSSDQAPVSPGGTVEPTVAPAPHPTQRPSRSGSPPPTSTPTATPTATPTSPPSTPVEPTTTAAPPPPSPPATASATQVQQRTWQSRGGTVEAECDGSSISLVAALPNAGFAVRVGSRGPTTLDVTFDGRAGDDGQHYRAIARCLGGVPAFAQSPQDD